MHSAVAACLHRCSSLESEICSGAALLNGTELECVSSTLAAGRRRYDGTVRNAVGDVIQFLYGEDGMDGAAIEVRPSFTPSPLSIPFSCSSQGALHLGTNVIPSLLISSRRLCPVHPLGTFHLSAGTRWQSLRKPVAQVKP